MIPVDADVNFVELIENSSLQAMRPKINSCFVAFVLASSRIVWAI